MDKEFKISNEAKDSIKEKSCNEAKKSGHCFNFTFNQSMNPQTDAQKSKHNYNDITTPKKDKMISAKAAKDKLHQAASQVVSPDGGSLYTGSRRNKAAVNTYTKTAKESKKMSALQTDRSFSGDRNLI
jgi:biotin carboxyl carrier protein